MNSDDTGNGSGGPYHLPESGPFGGHAGGQPHYQYTSTGAEPPLTPSGAEIILSEPAGGIGGPRGQALDWSEEEITERKSLSPFQASVRRLARDKRAMGSLIIIVFFVLLSVIGPHIYEHIGGTLMGGASGTIATRPTVYHGYTHEELIYTDKPPNGFYWLGTDALGRDILSRLMAGVTVSIIVSFVVVTIDILLGLAIGTLAGFFGGFIDAFLARFTDLMFAFPQLLLAILAAATLGDFFDAHFGFAGRLVLVSLTFGLTIWPQMARYVRGQTLQLKEQQFIEASRTVGTSNRRIITRHIVPNLFSIVITAATLDVVGIIIGEATISLLGLGVQPPGSSLGLMISDAAQQIALQPLEVVWPSLTLAILVISFSFLGDGINVAFNPRLKD
jgi:ABC-type dipeptide/oligopeptide/nickel transport system permease subunit